MADFFGKVTAMLPQRARTRSQARNARLPGMRVALLLAALSIMPGVAAAATGHATVQTERASARLVLEWPRRVERLVGGDVRERHRQRADARPHAGVEQVRRGDHPAQLVAVGQRVDEDVRSREAGVEAMDELDTDVARAVGGQVAGQDFEGEIGGRMHPPRIADAPVAASAPGYWMPSSSTSKVSVAFGGITPGTPRAP